MVNQIEYNRNILDYDINFSSNKLEDISNELGFIFIDVAKAPLKKGDYLCKGWTFEC